MWLLEGNSLSVSCPLFYPLKNTDLGRKAKSKSMLMSRLSSSPHCGTLLYEQHRDPAQAMHDFLLAEVRSSLEWMEILADVLWQCKPYHLQPLISVSEKQCSRCGFTKCFLITTSTIKVCIKTEFVLKFSQVSLILEGCYEEKDFNARAQKPAKLFSLPEWCEVPVAV